MYSSLAINVLRVNVLLSDQSNTNWTVNLRR